MFTAIVHTMENGSKAIACMVTEIGAMACVISADKPELFEPMLKLYKEGMKQPHNRDVGIVRAEICTLDIKSCDETLFYKD